MSDLSVLLNDLPEEALGRLEEICCRFEQSWQAGQRPRPEDFLAGIEGVEGLAVLRELLRLDVYYRRRVGEAPSAKDYATRFPKATALLSEMFLGSSESTVTCPRCDLEFAPAQSQAQDAPEPEAAARSGTISMTPRPLPTSAPLPTPTPTGQPSRIDRFEIRRFVGEGAFGRVYEAYDPSLKRLVALKVARPEQIASDHRIRRFQREAQNAALLLHPHIVAVFDSGQDSSQHYIASAFIDGQPLDAVLKNLPEGQTLPMREAVQIVRKLAEALAFAHKQGVIHRDLKPGNVMLRSDGEPLVMDFGLAVRSDEVEKLTQDGSVMGTPPYMAPEQWHGKAEAASDQYSLGCLLFELLTGRLPFVGGSTAHYMHLHCNEPVPSARALCGSVPRDLDTICRKCLDKEPKQRYRDCQELADDLRRFLDGEAVSVRPPGAGERLVKWARRNPEMASLTAALLLVTVLGVAGIVWKYLDAEQQKGIAEQQKNIAEGNEQEAQRETAKAKAVRDFLVSIFQFADPNNKRGTINAREILDEADNRIQQEFADQPELQQELLTVIEEVYNKIGLVAPAAMILEARGSVHLHAARGTNQPAVPQLLLFPGDRLQLGADAEVQLLVLSDLHKEQLNPAGEVLVRRKGCEPPDAVRERVENIPMTFVGLPKGTFYMGWDDTNTKKGVKTEIKEDFEMAIHTVTQGQWQAVMGNNPSTFSRKGTSQAMVANISDEELKLFPVETVSWEDAQEFIKKLNEKERGRGFLYRLPSEAEWEYARRGGATSEEECSYHFYLAKPTNDLSSEQANFDGDQPFGKAPKGKYLGRPTRVGAYPPNKLGLCDMHGNVWQWCADLFAPEGSARVYRGGGWNGAGVVCRTAFRYLGQPYNRANSIGIRLARVPVR